MARFPKHRGQKHGPTEERERRVEQSESREFSPAVYGMQHRAECIGVVPYPCHESFIYRQAGAKVRIDKESFENVRPNAAVAANIGCGQAVKVRLDDPDA